MSTEQQTTTAPDERMGWTSASNAEADLLCPGRHLASKGLVPPPATKEATFGRRIHAALAKRDPKGLDPEEFKVYEACVEIERAKVTAVFGKENVGKLVSFSEVSPTARLWARFGYRLENNPPFELAHTALPDRVYRIVGDPRLLVIEYKTLGGDVPETPRNMQLRDQAVLAVRHYMAVEAYVMVNQPLVTHDPEIVLYTAADITAAEKDLQARVLASNDQRSVRVPGDRQCKFCLAAKLGTCLEYHRWVGGMMPMVLSLMDVAPAGWPPETRKLFCDRFSVAQKWLDDTWEAMEAGAKNDPEFVPGYYLKPGVTRETVIDAQTVFERFLKLGGNQDVFVREAVDVVKTRLRTQLGIVTGEQGKALDARLKELVHGCTKQLQNKSSLTLKV